MPFLPPFAEAPAAMRALREHARIAILAALWAAPPAVAWLAHRGGMGWDLVTVLAAALAALVTLGSRPAQPPALSRLWLAACIALASGLLRGAGHDVLPAWLPPFAALLLAAALCDGRALALAGAMLAALALLPLARSAPLLPALAQAASLAATALAAHLAQRHWRHHARRRGTILRPPPARAMPAWSQPRGWALPSAVLVQAERGADGTLRLAVAAPASGGLRVTVT